MNIFQKIKYAIQISDNDQFLKAIEKKDKEIQQLDGEVDIKDSALMIANETISNLQAQLPTIPAIDSWCIVKYTKIPNIAYKDKSKINNKYYSVFINELITPDAYEVLNLKQQCKKESNRYTQIKRYGDKIALLCTWTDDKNLDKSGDMYLTPSQFLALKKGDCEDHAVTFGSMDEEVGLCWGFYYPETTSKPNNKFGHAFNCFVYEGKLYIVDTVGNECEIEEYTGQGHYTINYIITKNHTYVVDGSVDFGEIAGWTTESRTNNKQSKVANSNKKRR